MIRYVRYLFALVIVGLLFNAPGSARSGGQMMAAINEPSCWTNAADDYTPHHTYCVFIGWVVGNGFMPTSVSLRTDNDHFLDYPVNFSYPDLASYFAMYYPTWTINDAQYHWCNGLYATDCLGYAIEVDVTSMGSGEHSVYLKAFDQRGWPEEYPTYLHSNVQTFAVP